MSYATLAMERDSMTTIRTTCTTCGDVELTIDDVGLEMAAGSDEGRYRFDCPFCGMTQRRPASPRVVSVLLATGVGYDIVATASPITEAEIEAAAAMVTAAGQEAEQAAVAVACKPAPSRHRSERSHSRLTDLRHRRSTRPCSSG